MKSRSIDAIIQPCAQDLPLEPSVVLGDRVTHAIEVMLGHNLNRIAVVRNRRAIGMVRLEDAFEQVGLEMPGGGNY
jgi:signal-transduction protein with cAMP-binding, CBS, and nucleotidyltransferase domain